MKNIESIRDIDTTTAEGRLLVAALVMINTECLVPKSLEMHLRQCNLLANHMYEKQQAADEIAY